MQYKWDKKLLRDLHKNPVVREELHELYVSLWDVFNITSECYSRKNDTVVYDYQFFKAFPFVTELIYDSEKLPDLLLGEYTYQRQISLNEAFEIVHDFYKQTDDKIFSAFLKLFSQRFTHFKFYNALKSSFYCGNTYLSETANEVFISVNKANNISLATIITHEYGHGIDFLLNHQNCMISAKAQFDEIISIFMELILFDYLESYTHLANDLDYERKIYYSTLINDLEKLDAKLCIANEFAHVFENPDVADISFHELFSNVKKEQGFSQSEINKLMKNPAYATSPYVIGSLIALELYHIYQTDQEYAFYLLHQINTLEASTPTEIYNKIKELDINPTQSVDTYIRKLKL